jgi:hypothetical protein
MLAMNNLSFVKKHSEKVRVTHVSDVASFLYSYVQKGLENEPHIRGTVEEAPA